MNLLTFPVQKCVGVFPPIQRRNCTLAIQTQLLMSAISVHSKNIRGSKMLFSKHLSFSSIHTRFGNLLGSWKTTYPFITGKNQYSWSGHHLQ